LLGNQIIRPSIAIVGIEKQELYLLPVGADKSAFLII